jgi:hypothetical protein
MACKGFQIVGFGGAHSRLERCDLGVEGRRPDIAQKAVVQRASMRRVIRAVEKCAQGPSDQSPKPCLRAGNQSWTQNSCSCDLWIAVICAS